MKTLHRYILTSFLKPFLSTFLIALFILIMQALWLIFEDMAGKGVTLLILAKYMFYVSIVTVPQAIPIATLLASIMTLGNFSENYEFAATKSAGISLQKLLAPLFIFIIGLSFVNLFFLNNAFPWAVLKQKNLYKNIKEHKPALAFVEGTFNTDIKDYIIKFDKKYGKDENLLKNVLIYQLKKHNTINSITAEKGTILTQEGSRYMSLFLENGYFHEEHWTYGSKKEERKRMPFSKTHFDTYTVNIDISAFSEEGMDDIKFRTSRDMLSFGLLNYYSDSLSITYKEYLEFKAKNLQTKVKHNHLFAQKDTIEKYKIKMPILSNFDKKAQIKVTESAYNSIKRTMKVISSKDGVKNRRKRLNLIDTEFHRRIAIAFSALLLFLIGAPLGSLIRKGGFGLPMVVAIIVYLIYHFLSEFAKNMAEESTITNIVGGWFSTAVFLPFAILLTYRATRDKGAINLDPLFEAVKGFFARFKKD